MFYLRTNWKAKNMIAKKFTSDFKIVCKIM